VTGRAWTTVGSIGAIATAGVLAGVLLAASGSAPPATPVPYRAARGQSVADSIQQAVTARPGVYATTRVPSGLRPPAGNVLETQFAGRGVQVYQCTAGAWVFVEPAAQLVGYEIGTPGVQAAIHYKGPTWESTTDGSLIQGTAITSEPVTGSIPQLLLQATVNRGTGVFGRVTYINRLDTVGGAAPAGSCTSGQTVGKTASTRRCSVSTSNPERSSKLARPSRSRTSSSARTTRGAARLSGTASGVPDNLGIPRLSTTRPPICGRHRLAAVIRKPSCTPAPAGGRLGYRSAGGGPGRWLQVARRVSDLG
jgi:hypothetical protein